MKGGGESDVLRIAAPWCFSRRSCFSKQRRLSVFKWPVGAHQSSGTDPLNPIQFGLRVSRSIELRWLFTTGDHSRPDSPFVLDIRNTRPPALAVNGRIKPQTI